jgi:hypothetical protein
MRISSYLMLFRHTLAAMRRYRKPYVLLLESPETFPFLMASFELLDQFGAGL